MKHQYESEILFQLMERDGFNIPSSVPPYESEIKAYLINQVKQAYPKLTDYEAEWLLYNYTKHLPADFPISSATNVTKATFENVVPFAYQSAILKGCTKFVSEKGGVFESFVDSLLNELVIGKTINGGNGDVVDNANEVLTVKFMPIPPTPFRLLGSKDWRKIALYDKEFNYIKTISFRTAEKTDITSSDIENAVYCRLGYAGTEIDSTFRITDSNNTIIPYPNLLMSSVKTSTLKPVGKNLFNINRNFIETKASYSINGSSLIVTGDWYVRQDIVLMPYTTYTLSYEKAESVNGYTKISVYANNLSVSLGTSNTNKLTFTTPASFNNISVVFYAEEGRGTNTVTYTKIQLEEGTVATSYESCKMPVLTITGKNLFDGELEIGGLSNVNGLPVDNQPDRCRSKNYIKVNSSTEYKITVNHSGIVGIREFDEDYKLVSWASLSKGNTFTTTNQTKYLKFIVINTNVDNLVQLEEGTTATPYEPYKTNILTVNEDVELRGVEDVKDTLDCLTGELVERVGEIVLNGQEKWTLCGSAYQPKDTNYINYDLIVNDIKPSAPILCDTIKTRHWDISSTQIKSRSISVHSTNKLLRLCIEKTIAPNVESLKTYLSTKIAKVQYILAKESVKTVDLKTVNESGESVHFMPLEGTMNVQSSGEPIQPTFDMSVPVEATTQNLASFINLEMEE